MQHLMAFLCKNTDEILVFDLKQLKQIKSFNFPLCKIRVKNAKYFSLSPDCNYLALYETPKFLSLYRLKDSSRCAHVLLYSEINCMIITERFVSLAMKDKRVLSYLIVDPLVSDHEKRVAELPSRYIN